MPLTLKPNCECCNRDLPNGDPQARICTFECTFCIVCVELRLGNSCPNCGGDLVLRPTRPARYLDRFPSSTERVTRPHMACVATAA